MKKLTKPKPSTTTRKTKPSTQRSVPQNPPANENNPPEGVTQDPPPPETESARETTITQTTTEALPPEFRNASEPAHSGTSDLSHLDSVQIPVDTSQETAAAASLAADVANDNVAKGIVILRGPNGEEISIVDRATFRKTFFGMFNAGGMFLESLPIKPEETELANDASDAIYDTCCEVHWLHVVLKPGGVWLPRLLALYFFGNTKLSAVLAEVKAKRAARIAEGQPQQQAA